MIDTINDAIEAYDETLNDHYGEPMGYPASRILREVDPIAYRVGFHDWLDSEGIDSDTLTGDWNDLP